MSEVEALTRLWNHAAKGVYIRHPNPNTYVDIEIDIPWHCNGVDVNLKMRNLRDTSDLDRMKSRYTDRNGFTMKLQVKEWPGYEAARVAIVGTWAMYMQHEVCELVLDHPKGRAIVDPHGPGLGRFRQAELETVLGASSGDRGMMLAIEHVLGPVGARSMVEEGARQARRELEIEKREVESPSPYWG